MGRYSSTPSRGLGRSLGGLFILLLVLVLVGALVWLAGWNPPPPTRTIEKVLPDDRFPR